MNLCLVLTFLQGIDIYSASMSDVITFVHRHSILDNLAKK